MSRRAAALVAAILATGALAACGDDEETDRAATTATGTGTGTAPAEEHAQEPTGPVVATVEMSLVDFELDPADPEVDEAGVVEFELSNDGQAPHNLEVETPQGEFELEQDLQPGESATLKAELPGPGEYVMYCPVGDHRERGMEGTLTVTGGGGEGETETAPETGASGSASPAY